MAEICGAPEQPYELDLVELVLPNVIVKAHDNHHDANYKVEHRTDQEVAQIPKTTAADQPEEESSRQEECPYLSSLQC